MSQLTMTSEVIDLIDSAIERVFAKKPRPSLVNQKQAAEMLCVSEATMSKWVRTGRIRLNKAGYISITEIDRMLEES